MTDQEPASLKIALETTAFVVVVGKNGQTQVYGSGDTRPEGVPTKLREIAARLEMNQGVGSHAYRRDRSREARMQGDHDCAECGLPRNNPVHGKTAGQALV